MILPKIYKKTSTGAIQFWQISVIENSDHSTGYNMWTTYGQIDGKEQETVESIFHGKNVGKKNETSPKQQAMAEAQSRWEKKKKSGYVDSILAAKSDQTDALIEGGILPMLAHKFTDQGHKIAYPCFAQPKLDGIRCIAIVKDGKCTLWSRTRKPINSVPHIAEEVLKLSQGKDLVLDGELFNQSTNLTPYKCYDIKGQTVILDVDDIPKLEGYAIVISNGYPAVSIRRKLHYIHRLVLNNPNSDIDHINRNKLDARKSNLRITSVSENIANTTKRITNTSGYKGVVFFKRDSNWHAQITKDYKKIHIGYFETAELAARAYDKKALELFGDFCVLNFPIISKNTLSSFEDIVSAVRSESPTEQSIHIEYHIYDLPSSPLTFMERLVRLEEMDFTKTTKCKLVPTMEIAGEDEVMSAFHMARELGYEGVMLRNFAGKYANKRSYDLQKVKEFDEDEFEILGIEEGRGKLSGHVGAFICQTKDGRKFSAKPAGETSNLKKWFQDHSAWQGKLLTVQFQGLTAAENVPRFPVGKSIRDYE